MVHYSGYTADSLSECCTEIKAILAKSETAKLQAVRSKYNHGKFLHVSESEEIKNAVTKLQSTPEHC